MVKLAENGGKVTVALILMALFGACAGVARAGNGNGNGNGAGGGGAFLPCPQRPISVCPPDTPLTSFQVIGGLEVADLFGRHAFTGEDLAIPPDGLITFFQKIRNTGQNVGFARLMGECFVSFLSVFRADIDNDALLDPGQQCELTMTLFIPNATFCRTIAVAPYGAPCSKFQEIPLCCTMPEGFFALAQPASARLFNAGSDRTLSASATPQLAAPWGALEAGGSHRPGMSPMASGPVAGAIQGGV